LPGCVNLDDLQTGKKKHASKDYRKCGNEITDSQYRFELFESTVPTCPYVQSAGFLMRFPGAGVRVVLRHLKRLIYRRGTEVVIDAEVFIVKEPMNRYAVYGSLAYRYNSQQCFAYAGLRT